MLTCFCSLLSSFVLLIHRDPQAQVNIFHFLLSVVNLVIGKKDDCNSYSSSFSVQIPLSQICDKEGKCFACFQSCIVTRFLCDRGINRGPIALLFASRSCISTSYCIKTHTYSEDLHHREFYHIVCI